MSDIINALPAGTVLQGEENSYRVQQALGQGSFGITYLATSKVTIGGSLGKMKTTVNVAIKEFFMKDFNDRQGASVTASGNELFGKYRKKFVREALNLSRLQHPGIVDVIEIFEANNTSYIAMEYCDGGSLDDLIAARGQLPEQEALRYFDQISTALDYMHSRKMLHLDLKPGNIMLRDEGEAVLIDFGLSKQYDENGEPESSTTIGGGTPGYAPTEQADYEEGKGDFPVTMDIYALGATLYKMLTGVRPPKASAVQNDGLPIEPLQAAAVSQGTVAAIVKAMQPRKKDRYQSVAEFRAAIEDEATDVELPNLAAQGDDTDVEPQNLAAQGDCTDVEPQNLADQGEEDKVVTVPTPASGKKKRWLYAAIAAVAAVIVAVVVIAPPRTSPEGEWEVADTTAVALDTAASSTAQQVAQQQEQPIQLPQQPQQELQAQQQAIQQPQQEPQAQQQVIQQPQQEPQAQQVQQEQQVTLPAIEMVYVAGGTFAMGASDSDSEAYKDEKPAHSVTLSSYYIGKTEVTQRLWKAVMGYNPSYYQDDDLPVECVSWDNVQEFLRKLNQMTGKHYRLPTEAEWEYAARGGNRSRGYKYSGSDNIGSVAWCRDNSGGKTHPVGTKSANELGLYDMSGNVMEWCSDWYSDSYYGDSPSSNPKGSSAGSYRAAKGGSWNLNARDGRVSSRYGNSPGGCNYDLGFRLAL